MRLSVRDGDPGYCTDAWDARVFLNGVELHQCFTADEELGIAEVYETDADGKPVLGAPFHLREKTLRGAVWFVWNPPKPAPEPLACADGSCSAFRTVEGGCSLCGDPCL